MVYLDTSVVVSLLLPEPQSADALNWLANTNAPLASSWWLLPEAHSAISLKRRLKQIDDGQASLARRELDHFVENAIRLIPVSSDIFLMAAKFASQHKLNLRAGDALHVASAKISGAKSLATFDHTMAKNVHAHGITNVFNS